MDAKKIGAFIAGERKARQMTQQALAEELHVTDKAVSRWERGVGLPDIGLIEPLAAALDISVVELMHARRMEDTPCPMTRTEIEEALARLRSTDRRGRLRAWDGLLTKALEAIGLAFLVCSMVLKTQMQRQVPLWLTFAAGGLALAALVGKRIIQRALERS